MHIRQTMKQINITSFQYNFLISFKLLVRMETLKLFLHDSIIKNNAKTLLFKREVYTQQSGGCSTTTLLKAQSSDDAV